ncbi:MAG: hypothetical protein H7Y11_08270 [Armatimonadetes bacterium]|nr:hypothetical protein [Anaerolineae bacterium]
MLNQVYWEIQDRVMTMEFSGAVRTDDFINAIETAESFRAHLPAAATVHVINDVSRRAAIDRDLLSLSEVTALIRKHSLTGLNGWLVIVEPNPNPVLIFVAQTVAQITHFRLRIFNSKAAALRFLYKADPLLPQPMIESHD